MASVYVGPTVGAGGGTPGGDPGDLQYNNSGAFGGFGDWDGSVLTVPGSLAIGAASTSEQSLDIQAVATTPTGGNANGSTITIGAANGLGTGFGGYLSLHSGSSPLNGAANISLAGAQDASNGGDIYIQAGISGETLIPGATLYLQAGGAFAGNANGGDVAITAGVKSGSGTAGRIVLNSDTVLANGIALRGDMTDAHAYKFSVYDLNTGPAYVDWATITNGNTPSVVIAPPAGGTTISIQATTYKSSDGSSGVSAGPFTTISSITVKNGLVTALTGS